MNDEICLYSTTKQHHNSFFLQMSKRHWSEVEDQLNVAAKRRKILEEFCFFEFLPDEILLRILSFTLNIKQDKAGKRIINNKL